MKVFWKFLSIGTLLLVVLLAGAISLTIGWRPFTGPRARALTERRFDPTPERLARGRYLANAVNGCMFCHSEHNWQAPGAPIVEDKLGAGEVFPDEGLPGKITAPNLTPDPETGAGNWSDDQLARAIREGIGHDGRALFPLMPYDNFRSLPDEDLASLVVYLRSLSAVHNPLPKTEIIFPVKYLIRSVPKPLTSPVPTPLFADPVKRGEYLVHIASCAYCHTPQERGRRNSALELAGGFEMKGPFGAVTTANITPDPSGISYYNETTFMQTMRTGKVGGRALNPIMPWSMMRGMTDDDLKAIFAYLRTVPPIHHRVDNTLTPTLCKVCKRRHGGGDQN